MNRDPIALALAADESFALGLAVAVRSALDQRPPASETRVFVLDGGLKPQTRDKLEESWRRCGARVRFLPIELGPLGVEPHPGVPLTAYAKLLVAELLPPDLHRVLYLDADVLVLADLGPLFRSDLGEHTLLAVRDTMIPNLQTHFAPPELDAPEVIPNFNSGVMLIDLLRWRAEAVGPRALAFADRYRDRFPGHDQQALNCALAGRWGRLPLCWNRMTHALDIPSWRGTDVDADEAEAALRAPRVVHFAGWQKPWTGDCPDDHVADFFASLDRTRWSGWRPKTRPWPQRIRRSLTTRPHDRYLFVRKGLGVARQAGYPRWPWVRYAAGVALRHPWTLATYPAARLRHALGGRSAPKPAAEVERSGAPPPPQPGARG